MRLPPPDIMRALLLGAAITFGSIFFSLVPTYIWLQLDPVVEPVHVLISCVVIPAILSPICCFFILRTQVKAERLAAENYRLATVDELTGLPNRRAFFAGAETLRGRVGAAQLYCAIADIDSFKRVNDTHGHDTGDHVLKFVAGALGSALPEGMVLARLGGEEFAMAGRFRSERDARAAFEALVEAVSLQIFADETARLHVTISLGFSRRDGDETISDLLSQADEALYRAKRQGKNRAVFRDDATLPVQEPGSPYGAVALVG